MTSQKLLQVSFLLLCLVKSSPGQTLEISFEDSQKPLMNHRISFQANPGNGDREWRTTDAFGRIAPPARGQWRIEADRTGLPADYDVFLGVHTLDPAVAGNLPLKIKRDPLGISYRGSSCTPDVLYCCTLIPAVCQPCQQAGMNELRNSGVRFQSGCWGISLVIPCRTMQGCGDLTCYRPVYECPSPIVQPSWWAATVLQQSPGAWGCCTPCPPICTPSQGPLPLIPIPEAGVELYLSPRFNR